MPRRKLTEPRRIKTDVVDAKKMRVLVMPSGIHTIEDTLAFIAGHECRPATFEEAILYTQRSNRPGTRSKKPSVLNVIGTRWKLVDGTILFMYLTDEEEFAPCDFEDFLDGEREEAVLVVPLM